MLPPVIAYRCRAAVTNSGFEWPSTRRVTILLSPADLPKSGPHFDLGIAVAVLAAAGKVPRPALEKVVFVGELTLDGRLRADGLYTMQHWHQVFTNPPLCITEEQLREAFGIIDRALDNTDAAVA